jgi:hypothetical protein
MPSGLVPLGTSEMVGGTFFVLRILYIEQVVALAFGNLKPGCVVRIEGRRGGILQGGSRLSIGSFCI